LEGASPPPRCRQEENQELGSRSGHYDQVKRDVDAARSVLNSLTSRHKETDVAQS
jgi:uncharacterized protein involved in exopolysaccharide biosynthesis